MLILYVLELLVVVTVLFLVQEELLLIRYSCHICRKKKSNEYMHLTLWGLEFTKEDYDNWSIHMKELVGLQDV